MVSIVRRGMENQSLERQGEIYKRLTYLINKRRDNVLALAIAAGESRASCALKRMISMNQLVV